MNPNLYPKTRRSDQKTEASDSSDLNYECVKCGQKSKIESEVRQHTYNFCIECGSVNRHKRL